MDSSLIVWDHRPREIAADPAATLSLDRDRWHARGARFDFYDDEIGGVTAVATASTRNGGSAVQFGVLDYGEATSYLVVAGSYAQNAADVDTVLEALIADGTITPSDVIERLPSGLDADIGPTGAAGDASPAADASTGSDDVEERSTRTEVTPDNPDRSATVFVSYADADAGSRRPLPQARASASRDAARPRDQPLE